MPFSFAFAAMRWPTSSAPLRLPPFLSWPRTSFSAVDAAAGTLSPAGDHDLGLRRGRDLDALGHLVHHGMRKAEREVQLVALRLRAKAHADEREPALEALGDAGHHIGH